MNNKGFTLIELIATIALLAIISVISFVSINNVIKQSKINDCNTLVSNIKNAANEYVSDNRYKSSFVNNIVDYSLDIDASVLTNNKYLGTPIINPFNKSEISPIDVLIRLEFNDDYTLKMATISEPAVLMDCQG